MSTRYDIAVWDDRDGELYVEDIRGERYAYLPTGMPVLATLKRSLWGDWNWVSPSAWLPGCPEDDPEPGYQIITRYAREGKVEIAWRLGGWGHRARAVWGNLGVGDED